MYIEDKIIWHRLGGYSKFTGVHLNRYNWDFIWEERNRKKVLPSFKLNLFIQAKRPYSGRAPKYGFKKKCYKFDITNHQQEVLEKIAEKLKDRALVVYAAPIFNTSNELYKYTQTNKMIEKSTFPDVKKLHGHSHWYYNNNSDGLACSETEFMEFTRRFKICCTYARWYYCTSQKDLGTK